MRKSLGRFRPRHSALGAAGSRVALPFTEWYFQRKQIHRSTSHFAAARQQELVARLGAFLAEFFPSRIRYTSVSVPYHIGNGWGGGLVPFITTAACQATGSVGYALIYPIAVPAVCFVLSLFLMPETRQISIWNPETKTA